VFFRCLAELPGFWRIWVPVLVLAIVMPPTAMGVPLVEKQLIDQAIVPLRLDPLPGLLALYGALWVANTLGFALTGALRSRLCEQLMLRLRQHLFDHCERLSLAFSRRSHSGRTMALFLNDIPILAELFSTTVFAGLAGLIALLVGVVVMFSLSWQLAIVAGLVPPLVVGVAALVTRPLRPAARQAQDKAAELGERLQENLAGIREVVAFGQEAAQRQRFATTMGELFRLRWRVTLIDTTIRTGQELFSLALTVVVLGYGAYLVIQGETTLGTVIAMRTLFLVLLRPAGQVFGLVPALQRTLGAADRVYGFLDEAPRVEERPVAHLPHPTTGAVSFDDVSFAYEPGHPVLRDVSLAARAGEVIALVGPSGAGKSTLASLIARFYDPTAGCVRLDGVDLRDLPLAELRSQIGMVFQDTFLFSATVRDNIAFGRPGATDDDVVAAAQAANAWEFIERLPNGLDTEVGERGMHLSEGQRQRLAIARALLRDPRILILDEPTSALDARSEQLLQGALDALVRGRTTFVIAHRLATVRRADRIVVLDQGRIIERGSHNQLLQAHGLYRELFTLQFGELERLPAAAKPPLAAVGAEANRPGGDRER
jgi:subfamily B ATP-binding cassette protein MsbA